MCRKVPPQAESLLRVFLVRRASAGRAKSSGNVVIVVKGEQFTEDDAQAHIHGICFKTGPPRRVGVELEWLVRDRHDPALPVQPGRLAAALDGLEPNPKIPRTVPVTGGKHDGSFGINILLFHQGPRSRLSLAGSLS